MVVGVAGDVPSFFFLCEHEPGEEQLYFSGSLAHARLERILRLLQRLGGPLQRVDAGDDDCRTCDLIAGIRDWHRRDAQLERTLQSAEELDASIDFLTWDLQAAALDHLGPAAALAQLVSGWSRRVGIHAQHETFGLDGARFTPEVETNLYRLTQEALHNIYKHAKADRVSVLLKRRDSRRRSHSLPPRPC